MRPVISITDLNKVYAGGFQALENVSLEINKGEIFGLLGPNGAGKTTLINIVCGIVNPTSGTALVDGDDIVSEFRATRRKIGLVPQELPTETFESVINTLRFSRGLFGRSPDEAHIEKVLRSLSLWDKRDTMIMHLSGGMKRRVLIAKALSHEPEVLFLDEPTAGVDVELRQDMWKMVHRLNQSGVTIILTTHYIEEAEEIADRVGIINHGELLLVDDKKCLMQKLGKKQLLIELKQSIEAIPAGLEDYNLEASDDGSQLTYTYDPDVERTGITALLQAMHEVGLKLKDLKTSQSSLEEIFVRLVNSR